MWPTAAGESAQVRELTLDVEISRELVPLRNGYRHIGQKARVRLASGLDYDVPGASALERCRESSGAGGVACTGTVQAATPS